MARPLRIQLPDAWYHVMSRGNARQLIFVDDNDCRNFLSLVAELPGRFSLEIHAFVLMGNHFHLLVRTREANLSDAIRWLNVTYTIRFNRRHRRSGHLVQGRFKAVLIRDETRIAEVARYLHLNPVRVGGLGLGKEQVQRARNASVADPGRELVEKRLEMLREHRWNSWRVYSGLDASVPWLDESRVGGACGGRSRSEQRRALRAYTEAPIRQGHMENPWEGLVGGVVLGDELEAQRLLAKARVNLREQPMARRVKRRVRPEWESIVKAAEALLGRPWKEVLTAHADWGRDAVLAVSMRELGWRLTELTREIPGLRYPAAAQGVKRFWKGAESDPAKKRFVESLVRKMSKIQI